MAVDPAASFARADKKERQKILAKLEREEIEKISALLDGPSSPDASESLVESLTKVLFKRISDLNRDLFTQLTEKLGAEVIELISADSGAFSVVRKSLHRWVLCDSGTVWMHPGEIYEIEFQSGLTFQFLYNPGLDNEEWRFNARGTKAVLEFGYPLACRLLPVEVGVGEGRQTGLLIQAELSPVIVATREPVVKLLYNLYHQPEIRGEGRTE